MLQKAEEGIIRNIPENEPMNLYESLQRNFTPQAVDEELTSRAVAAITSHCTSDAKKLVYFIQADDVIKIGTAADVSKRMKDLQTPHSRPLSLRGIYRGGFKLERTLHAILINFRIRENGEWFKLDGTIEAILEHSAHLRFKPDPEEEEAVKPGELLTTIDCSPIQPPTIPPHLNLKQAAEYLAISPDHITRLIAVGKLGYSQIGRIKRIKTAEIDQFVLESRLVCEGEERGESPLKSFAISEGLEE
jgi:excisionase family DNA binding protein